MSSVLIWTGFNTGPNTDAGDSFWQVGIGAVCNTPKHVGDGIATYFAFYEYFNDALLGTIKITAIDDFPVEPGNSYDMQAALVPNANKSGRHPLLSLSIGTSRGTKEWSFSGSTFPKPARNAQCIVERSQGYNKAGTPTVWTHLAKFATVTASEGCLVLDSVNADSSSSSGYTITDTPPAAYPLPWKVTTYTMIAGTTLLATVNPQGPFLNPVVVKWKAAS